jgi:acid phosphatase
MTHRTFALVLSSLLVVAVACSSSPIIHCTSATASVNGPCLPARAQTPQPTRAAHSPAPSHASQPNKVVVIVMENSPYDTIANNPALPFIHGTIAPRSEVLTQMYADSAPSLPNYVWMTAGQSCGSDGSDSAWDRTCPSLFDQLDKRGIGWTVFAEGYPGDAGTCFTGVSSDAASNDYARKHVPPLLFTSTSSGTACTDHVRNFPNDTPADGSPPVNNFAHVRLPTVTFVIPNLCHDMHNASAQCGAGGGGQLAGDRWLQLNWGSLLTDAGPEGAVILTWDEGETAGEHIATFVGGKHLLATGSDGRRFDHSSTLRAIEDAFGLPCLAGACHAAPLPILVAAR